MEANPLEPWSFRDFMDDKQDAAQVRVRNVCRETAGKVTGRRVPPVVWRTVAEVAVELGVSSTYVKLLAAAGRFGVCRRPRNGTGRPWLIPAHRTDGGGHRGSHAVRVAPGKRGPKASFETSGSGFDPVPF